MEYRICMYIRPTKFLIITCIWLQDEVIREETIVTTVVENRFNTTGNYKNIWRTFTGKESPTQEEVDAIQNLGYGPWIVWGLFGNRVTGVPHPR